MVKIPPIPFYSLQTSACILILLFSILDSHSSQEWWRSRLSLSIPFRLYIPHDNNDLIHHCHKIYILCKFWDWHLNPVTVFMLFSSQKNIGIRLWTCCHCKAGADAQIKLRDWFALWVMVAHSYCNLTTMPPCLRTFMVPSWT